MIKRRLFSGWLLIFAGLLQAEAFKPLVSDADAMADIKRFANELATEHQFDENTIIDQLSGLKQREDIIARITRPAESLPWYRYRKIFISEQRIDGGVEFWERHQETLARASAEFGVDPAMIVGILGVETFYGRIQGDFPVIEALHTLGFYYPKRAPFFRSELAQYYLLARAEKWNLFDVRGSYAGAMGMGQFISSSYRHYGVDFNQDGKINLFSDPVDMIGSVANYFARHGWQQTGFVAEPVALSSKQQTLVQKQLELERPLEYFSQAGVSTAGLRDRTKVAGIFAFETEAGQFEHWLTGKNFYVITRYNHSEMYALVAFQLSQAIAEKRLSKQVANNLHQTDESLIKSNEKSD